MNMPDILLTKDWNDFLTHFVVYLYQEYGLNTHKSFDVSEEKQEEMEYFQMKYESDVHLLYKEIQEIAIDTYSNLFDGKIYEPLLYYLSFVCDCKDPYHDDIESIEDMDEQIMEQEIY